MNIAERIFETVKPLPESLAREVLDFAEFLRSRGEHGALDNLAQAQANSMRAAWDNPDDEVWNDIAGR